mmetsp:Transcript_35676/g.87762  ORF Transcript_35676/g.87762 Transcript_35676/m.87762 type:complete len:267 (+) Transcript_35676:126-926(+)|eukprot:CAMPEP_0206253280 /NCGR_PEP_ID=MMETSP0047_2-20121206/23068_1 /ASSEMBLY_ACC=CAM_ASM_000192 /TAXON_ID=195065 /ORGANISM="Chroomonas mesostigmatica_cf, Strain CCMP1168" /LENGTH=266 /DNA_ID=CAMNT_0053679479 /DNA_START=87 /DNA_END=887 /DNA_ORIENTATION=-
MSTRMGGIASVESGLGSSSQERRKPISAAGAKFAEEKEQEKLQRASSTRILITDNQKKKYQEAFDQMDANGNGLLESDEIYTALRYIGIPVTADELDYMLSNVKHDDAIGMTFDEFVHMMDQAEVGFQMVQGKGQSLGGLLKGNMKKVAQYKSKHAEELARRNEIRHKTTDDGLDNFLKQNPNVCARCHTRFEADKNGDSACEYHPKFGVTEGSSTDNHNQRIKYPCCGRIQVGLSPVYEVAPGCCKGRHYTPAEYKKDPSLHIKK